MSAAMLLMIAVLVGWLLLRRQIDIDAARLVADFQRQFPGRCLICSLHKFGVQNGHAHGHVEAHDCIEEPKP